MVNIYKLTKLTIAKNKLNLVKPNGGTRNSTKLMDRPGPTNLVQAVSKLTT